MFCVDLTWNDPNSKLTYLSRVVLVHAVKNEVEIPSNFDIVVPFYQQDQLRS